MTQCMHRPRRPELILAAVLAAVVPGSPVQAQNAAAKPAARDSAGVRIVQNAARDVRLPAREISRIGKSDGRPEDILYSVYSVAIDPRGNHYIGMEAEIRVFDRAGKYVRTIGRKGKGPGEFGMPPFPLWFSGDSLMAMDRNLMRTSAFTLDGKLIDTYSSYNHKGLEVRPIGRSNLSWIALVEDRIDDIHDEEAMMRMYSYIKLAPGQVGEYKPIELRRYFPANDSLGATVYRIRNEKIIGTKEPPGFVQRAFEDRPAYVVTPAGFVFAKVPTEYRVDVFDQNGRMVRSVRRSYTPIRVSAKDFDGMAELMVEAGLLGAIFPNPSVIPQYKKERLRGELARVDRLKKQPLPPSRHPIGRIFASANNTLWVERSDLQTPAERAAFVSNSRYRIPTRWDLFDGSGAYLGTTDLPIGFRPMNVADDGNITGVYRDEDDVEYVVTYQVLNRKG
ncbi:MAG TPA: 6-bladed beta-propeller [Longimicrobiales bacterium]